MRFAASLLALALVLPGLMACQGQLAPLSAQRGSTIVIPLEGVQLLTSQERERVGYGGREVSDPQRGELRYRLDGPGGFELVTLGSSRVQSHAGNAQLVSLVEIPPDAPLGSHEIYVAHRRFDPATGDVVEQPGPDYNGALQILPEAITVDLPGGGTELIEGQPTPLEFYSPGEEKWVALGGIVQNAAPDVEVRVKLQSLATDPIPIHAARVLVTVEESVAELTDARDATPFTHHPATVWMSDEGASGGLRSHLVSAVSGGRDIRQIALPFQLVDSGAALLDPADVVVSVEKAWDEEGTEISVAVDGGPTIF